MPGCALATKRSARTRRRAGLVGVVGVWESLALTSSLTQNHRSPPTFQRLRQVAHGPKTLRTASRGSCGIVCASIENARKANSSERHIRRGGNFFVPFPHFGPHINPYHVRKVMRFGERPGPMPHFGPLWQTKEGPIRDQRQIFFLLGETNRRSRARA